MGLPLRKALSVLTFVLYPLAAAFALVAAIPMVLHVHPQSECILFSNTAPGGKLFYGHYASCNFVAYVYLFVVVGIIYLFFRCVVELNKLKGHHPEGPYVEDKVSSHILLFHCLTLGVALLLALIVTVGYVVACNNLHSEVSKNVQDKLNENPYDTRGEEIKTRFEDDYKFHRYTHRYGNAFGSEFYTIRITCRSIMTDPDIHQRLHDSHIEQHSRYYGYWYGTDLYAYDSRYESSKTNSLVEASMSGCWICVILLLISLVLILAQRFFVKKKKMEQDRISMHSAVLGNGSVYVGADNGSMMSGQFRRDGSLISGSIRGPQGSNFQRGGSRMSDRSIRSSVHRRDIDDLALSSILQPRTPATTPGTARRNVGMPSHHSSRETGYVSDGGGHFGYEQQQPLQPPGYQPPVAGGGVRLSYPNQGGAGGGAVPYRQTADATYLSRDEVETEIF